MKKPIVFYSDIQYPPVIGGSAYVFPLNHPNPNGLVSNTSFIQTSRILKINNIGFETENTIYMPRLSKSMMKRVDAQSRP